MTFPKPEQSSRYSSVNPLFVLFMGRDSVSESVWLPALFAVLILVQNDRKSLVPPYCEDVAREVDPENEFRMRMLASEQKKSRSRMKRLFLNCFVKQRLFRSPCLRHQEVHLALQALARPVR